MKQGQISQENQRQYQQHDELATQTKPSIKPAQTGVSFTSKNHVIR
jgi:hypothetical protein